MSDPYIFVCLCGKALPKDADIYGYTCPDCKHAWPATEAGETGE